MVADRAAVEPATSRLQTAAAAKLASTLRRRRCSSNRAARPNAAAKRGYPPALMWESTASCAFPVYNNPHWGGGFWALCPPSSFHVSKDTTRHCLHVSHFQLPPRATAIQCLSST